VKDVDIKIRWCTKLRRHWAVIHKPSKKRPYYLINIQRNAPLWEIAGTLMHEMLHMLFWTYFAESKIDEDKEHVACDAVDLAGKQAVKEYMGIKEDL